MKKRYLKTSIASLIFQIVILAALILDINYIILITIGLAKGLKDSDLVIGIILLVILYLGLVLLGYLEVTFYVGNIVLEEKRIYCSGDIRYGRDKIQYKTSVDYKDIKYIEIAPLRKRSNGQRASFPRPIPYLIIRTAKKKNVLFALHFMSSKTVKNVIDNLLEKCEQVGNKIEVDPSKLLKDFKQAALAIEPQNVDNKRFLVSTRFNIRTYSDFGLVRKDDKYYNPSDNSEWEPCTSYDYGWGPENGFYKKPLPGFNELMKIVETDEDEENCFGATAMIQQKYIVELKEYLLKKTKEELPKAYKKRLVKFFKIDKAVNWTASNGMSIEEIEKEYKDWETIAKHFAL